MEKKSLPERSIAVAAWVTAVAALTVSIWQGYETRRHNRLSVMPRLNIDQNNTGTDFLGLSVSNHGLGPAEIKSIHIYVDGQAFAGGDESGWLRVLEKLGINEPWVNYQAAYGQPIYPTGSSRQIFGVTQANYNVERGEKFRKALERVGIVVCYCSLYLDCDNVVRGKTSGNPCG